MAKLLYTAPSVLSQIHSSGPSWEVYKSQELSVLAWSFATCHCSAGVADMARELSLRVTRQPSAPLDAVAPVDIGQMLWALAVTGNYAADIFLPLLRSVATTPMQHILLMECYTAALGFAVEHPAGAEAVMSSVRDAFPRFDEARDLLRAQKPSNSSRTHLAVSDALNQLSVPHENEYATSDGHFLDIAILGRRLALEIHGPMHFLQVVGSSNDLEILEGSTQFKARLLQRRGWLVRHLSAVAFRQATDHPDGKVRGLEFISSHL